MSDAGVEKKPEAADPPSEEKPVGQTGDTPVKQELDDEKLERISKQLNVSSFFGTYTHVPDTYLCLSHRLFSFTLVITICAKISS